MESISLNFTDCPPQIEHYFLRLLETRYRVVREDRPEFLIYALTGHRHRLYNCTKIYTHHETYRPNWKESDYAVLPFDPGDPRVLYLPLYAFDRSPAPLIRGRVEAAAIRAAKPRFCALLSNYADRSVAHRIRFFHLLNRRRRVDSVGRGLNNAGFAGIPGHDRKLEFYRQYRFILSFENKDLPGWVTEKMYDPLAVHAIPIFWGDRGASRYFNPAAYIQAHDFGSLEELADHVVRTDDDPELYRRYVEASPFHENRAPDVFAEERTLDFFAKIFRNPVVPAAQRRWFFPLTKWRLAKRNKLPTE